MFSKVLIANRGEIACPRAPHVPPSGIRTVAIYSDADEGAMHVRLPTKRCASGPREESYLHIDAIVAAAKQTGAEAIHPGYGLLSEKFGVRARGGRRRHRVHRAAARRARRARRQDESAPRRHRRGRRSVPGLDEPLPLDDAERSSRSRANTASASVTRSSSRPSGGGGGIGMQIVESADKLERAMKTCADRARAAFGDARVYLERYLRSPKHIEVQGLCDGRGGVISLGERECSVQRRHQKIVEESPSPAPFFREAAAARGDSAVEDAALTIFRHAGYVGAGTCEFIVGEDGQAFFLEVNARLQVEHPVTEM